MSDDVVESCLLEDELFQRAWLQGLDALMAVERRGRLSVDIGTIAESVATLLLLEVGLEVFGELAAAGVHGVDALALTPAGQVLAVEVKGTLRRSSLPRLGRGRSRQMSLAWLSSPSNPLMSEWDLTGADLYGGIAHLDFASGSWRVVLTGDHEQYVPVTSAGELLDLGSLERAVPA
jgi:hypothetical protein